MMENNRWQSAVTKLLGYVLVAAAASVVTFFLCLGQNGAGQSKLEQLEMLLDERFIGEADIAQIENAAADAMVNALGDRWSYYMSAEEYTAYLEQMNNAYVGIGVTITVLEDETGFLINKVEPGSAAQEVGLLAGDVITGVEGKTVAELGISGAKGLIRGKEGTQVKITVLRDGETTQYTLTRKTIQVTVATGQMLEDKIGLVTIKNFDSRCAEETIAAVEALLEQGTEALIFDVRNNPGGYKNELVKLLDYLLPEGELFRSQDYTGRESVDTSDAACLKMPMAVLVNGDSYSAAEFFAAALSEYGWATVIGQQTCGKGYFQQTYQLKDGSAVALSVGRYFTPKGVSLAEVGGLEPDIPVEVDAETAAKIYAGILEPKDDPQILAAVESLKGK